MKSRSALMLLTFFAVAGKAEAQTPRALGYSGNPPDYSATIRDLTYVKVGVDSLSGGLPTALDWRDLGAVTPAKDQGACGSCWAFASTAVFESKVQMTTASVPSADLSEQQLISCSPYGTCDAGTISALRYWEEQGPIEEACSGYPDFFTTSGSSLACTALDPCESLRYRTSGYYTVNIGLPNDIKSSVYQDGPATIAFNVYSDFFTYWDTGTPGQVYVQGTGSFAGGHAVELIGWDDTKGAWLCKNSWGELGGPNDDGTFWLAYTGHANALLLGMANVQLGIVDLRGDIDDFHPGDPADHLVLSPEAQELMTQALTANPTWGPPVDLDQNGANRPLGVTHFFSTSPLTPIRSASLKFRFRGIEFVRNDLIFYRGPFDQTATLIALQDVLGFEPVAGQPYEVTIDLSRVPVRTPRGPGDWPIPGDAWAGGPDGQVNLLPELYDGQLDLVFMDDVELDYSELSIQYGSRTTGTIGADTPVGTSVVTTPIPEVEVSFDTVTAEGLTLVTLLDATSPLPPAYDAASAIHYDIVTSATYGGNVVVKVHYDPSQFTNKEKIRLLHNENGQFVDVTTGVDTTTEFVAGQVSALSDFVLAEFLEPTLSDFVLYAENSVALRRHGGVEGNVGANGPISLLTGLPSTLAGDVRALGRITIFPRNTVTGDVVSNHKVKLLGNANVLGDVVPFASQFPIEIPDPTISFGTPTEDIDVCGTDFLSPGSYRDVLVKDDAELSLISGPYYLNSLVLGSGARVLLDLTNGPISIYIRDALDMGDKASVAPSSADDSADAVFRVSRDCKVRIGERASFRGQLFAPNALVSFERGSALLGAAYANTISADRGASFAAP